MKDFLVRLADEIQHRQMLEAEGAEEGSGRHKIATYRWLYERDAAYTSLT